jgi:hypothetical protein
MLTGAGVMRSSLYETRRQTTRQEAWDDVHKTQSGIYKCVATYTQPLSASSHHDHCFKDLEYLCTVVPVSLIVALIRCRNNACNLYCLS